MNRFVYPVIHHLTSELTLAQADLAFAAGADGVFLISHHGRDGDLYRPAQTIKAKYPGKRIGLNCLTLPAFDGYEATIELGLDMYWADDAGVSSTMVTTDAILLQELILNYPQVQFFGSVAFKYQRVDPNPGKAAAAAATLGMIPTTSGEGTGKAPSLEKITTMSRYLDGGDLAVASGFTPDNVSEYLPYVSHYLVATGISSDMYHFDPVLMQRFIVAVK